MTLTEKLTAHMKVLEYNNKDISTMSNSKLVLSYYYTLGMSMNESVSEWILGTATGKYPHYESVTRAIRKARELNPKWRKPNKQKEVDTVKEEVGYGYEKQNTGSQK